MKNIILISDQITIRNAVATVLINNGYSVTQTTLILNVFDVNRVPSIVRNGLVGIMIDNSIIGSDARNIITRLQYKDIPIFIYRVERHDDDTNDSLPALIANEERFIFTFNYE